MPTYFPSTDITGFPAMHWRDVPPDYQNITESFEYEDGGKDFNEVAPAANAPRRWELHYDIARATHAAAKADYATFDNFYDTVRFAIPFYFTDKYGNTWDKVRIERYSRAHSDHRSWNVPVEFTLVGYGSSIVASSSPAPVSDYEFGGLVT